MFDKPGLQLNESLTFLLPAGTTYEVEKFSIPIPKGTPMLLCRSQCGMCTSHQIN
jgi:hypothetical protein